MKSILLLIVLLLTPDPESWQGKVVTVIDGDTLEVMHDGKGERIRLNGIDCPEKAQAFGTQAKQFTLALAAGQHVTVKPKEIDRYGRTIADIYLEDGKWLNKALIEAGLAWHYKYYSSDESLAKAELEAKQGRVGLWVDKEPMAPWDFRTKNRK